MQPYMPYRGSFKKEKSTVQSERTTYPNTRGEIGGEENSFIWSYRKLIKKACSTDSIDAGSFMKLI